MMLPYQNPQLDIEARLDDLISRMTLQEMALQTDIYSCDDFMRRDEKGMYTLLPEKLEPFFRGMSVGAMGPRCTVEEINELQRYAVEKTRLGIPFLFCSEALHGAAFFDATCFPQQIGLAATFDPSLGRRMGRAVAKESRSRGICETFSPVMDLGRDPRWGRTEESYGEDTHLSAEFARETVLGLQGDDLRSPDAVASEPKHYTGYGSPVGGLNCAPCSMSRHEVFTDAQPVFEAAVKDAGAMNVMCSYTAIGNTPVSMDHEILTDVLREQWGMRGFVRADMTAVSRLYDWFYITETEEEAIRLGMEAGVDMQLHDFSHETWQQGLVNLVESGEMDRSVLERAARRILRVKMMLGLFENPYVDPALEKKVFHCDEHVALAKEIAQKSICLLKNEGNILPLSKELKKIAVIGPCADKAMLGDYTADAHEGVSLLEGLKRLLPETELLHEPGCGFLGNMPLAIPTAVLRNEEGNPGLTGRYYMGDRAEGEPVLVRTDAKVDYNWSIFYPDGTIFSDQFRTDRYCTVWTGTMQWQESFDGFIGFGGEDSLRLYVDGELLLDLWGEKRFGQRLIPFAFRAGQRHSIRIEFTNDQQGALLRFGYLRGLEDFTAAAEAARQAEVAIVCVGDSGDTSGENFDRKDLNLPGNQLALVKAVYATGTPVILVMQSGRPVSCTWEHTHIPGILQCWFPGEQGGHAIAETLFGDNNPCGHLPVTFPRHVGQVPCHYTRRPGGGRKYVDMSWMPLYPFGYGLSYTDFEFRGLRLSAERIAPGDSITAFVTVANTGSRSGAAVPQLYIRDWVSSTVKPMRYLAAFDRVELQPGEEKEVAISIGPRAMRTLDPKFNWSVEPGKFTVYLGENAEKMVCEQSFTVE